MLIEYALHIPKLVEAFGEILYEFIFHFQVLTFTLVCIALVHGFDETEYMWVLFSCFTVFSMTLIDNGRC